MAAPGKSAPAGPAGPSEPVEGFADRTLNWFGAYTISFVGLLHLLLSGAQLEYAVYLTLLFLANFTAAMVAALGMVWTGSRWSWLLGVAVAGGAFVVFFVSRMFGLPGYPEADGQWFNFGGWMALTFEIVFLAAAPLALTRRGRKLVGAEQARISREELPPARQETPEHFRLIEKEMREIRSRMAPDARDLRAHLEPRKLGRRAKQDARTRLHTFLRGVRGPGR